VKVNVGVVSFVVDPSAPGDWESEEGVLGFWFAGEFTVSDTVLEVLVRVLPVPVTLIFA
jgi:hypothetical protein